MLNVLVDDVDVTPILLGLCAGYEDGGWRAEALAKCLLSWVIDWALPHSEREALSSHNAFAALERALNRVYKSEKPASRGEVGELLLHIAIRSNYSTEPAISKIFFKDTSNDTVKGFDAVHIVANEQDELELWLGESKFYTNLNSAIRDVIAELQDHLTTPYLRSEFAAVTDKIDARWPHAERLRLLLQPETSLDQVFARAVVPVLLTYDSAVTSQYKADSIEYREEIETELRAGWQRFCYRLEGRDLPREVSLRLILVPMSTKALLLAAFDKRLKALQVGMT